MVDKKIGLLKVVPIKEVKNETPDDSRIPVKSFTFNIPEIAEKATPGQFIMMWLYGHDEKPMGIATADTKTGDISLAVAKMGKTTTAFHQLAKGELVGIRGPYGKGFTLKGEKIAIIGGGTGIAPSRFLLTEALKKGIEVVLFHGARSLNELAYKDYFKQLQKKETKFTYKPSTDDGSYGFKGFATQCSEAYFTEGNIVDQIYTCGPELMMLAAYKQAIAKELPIEASLADRYFKCAVGLCGQCTVDPLGVRLCIDGPVFNEKQLKRIEDFGKFARDKFGRKEPF